MSNTPRCAYCREPIEGEVVTKLGKTFCSEACAFEATGRPRPKQCGVPLAEPKPEGARQG